jgi:hypothetical protein
MFLRVYPLLGKDPINTFPQQLRPTRNNRGYVTIRDAYSRCYVSNAAYACAVTSHNNTRCDAGGVSFGSALRLYNEDLTQLKLELGRVLEMAVERGWEKMARKELCRAISDLKLQWDCDKSVARIRLVKTGNPSACATVNCKVCRIKIVL